MIDTDDPFEFGIDFQIQTSYPILDAVYASAPPLTPPWQGGGLLDGGGSVYKTSS